MELRSQRGRRKPRKRGGRRPIPLCQENLGNDDGDGIRETRLPTDPDGGVGLRASSLGGESRSCAGEAEEQHEDRRHGGQPAEFPARHPDSEAHRHSAGPIGDSNTFPRPPGSRARPSDRFAPPALAARPRPRRCSGTRTRRPLAKEALSRRGRTVSSSASFTTNDRPTSAASFEETGGSRASR